MKRWKYICTSLFYLAFCGQLLAQPSVLVVRDYLANGGDAVQAFSDIGADVTEITTNQLQTWDISSYCVVYVTGIDCQAGDPVHTALNSANTQLEAYVAGGGTLFYETGSPAPFNLPGGLTTVEWIDWENFVVPGHPIADTLPYMLSANCSEMSTNYFDNLPPVYQTITTTSNCGEVVTVSYLIGAGEVIATGTKGEYGIVGTECWYYPDDTGHLWMAIAQYCVDNCDPGTTEVEENLSVYRLRQNYPNPFNPSTTIHFNLPEAASVILAVYNMAGEQVRLMHSGLLSAGEHSFDFVPGNLASGNYIYQLESEQGVLTKKMVLLK